MSPGLSKPLLSQLSQSIADQTGLHFPPERWADLERGIRAAAIKLGHGDLESCVEWILSAPLNRKALEIVATELTVGETYFFREMHGLEIVSEQILPELARLRRQTERRLRIWSAGCCSGEEPYTIAILLDRFFPEFRDWHVTILGTDINPLFLQKAKEGIYSEWSFRDAPPWLKANYFKPINAKHYAIAPRIKERVSFAYLNLGEDCYPSLATNTNAMDLIFCRNVLMYFTPERVKKVVRHFQQTLVEGGWLLVSPTETSSEIFTSFSRVQFESALLYRKGGKSSAPAHEALSPERTAAFLKESQPLFQLPLVEPTIVASTPDLPVELATPPDPYREALALFEQGHYAEAGEKLPLDPTSSGTSTERAILLARIWANLGDLTQARSWAEQALRSDKLNAGLNYLRAMILQEQGAEETMAAFKRVLYLDPKFVLAHFALGHLALREGKDKEAAKYFENVLGLLVDYQPNDLLLHSDGMVAGRLREMVETALAMERAA